MPTPPTVSAPGGVSSRLLLLLMLPGDGNELVNFTAGATACGLPLRLPLLLRLTSFFGVKRLLLLPIFKLVLLDARKLVFLSGEEVVAVVVAVAPDEEADPGFENDDMTGALLCLA